MWEITTSHLISDIAVGPGAVEVAVESVAHHIAQQLAVAMLLQGRLPLDDDLRGRASRPHQALRRARRTCTQNE